MIKKTILAVIGLLIATAGPAAWADYETHPEMLPDYRCGGGTPPPGFPDVLAIPAGITPGDPGGTKSLHCQRTFWDLPAANQVGQRAVAKPFHQDRIPRFPNGITDRIPPLYTDGVNGYEQQDAGNTRLALCPLDGDGDGIPEDPKVRDPDLVPWWAPVLAEGSNEPQIGTAPGTWLVGDPAQAQSLYEVGSCKDEEGKRIPAGQACPTPGSPLTGPLYEVQCRRGTRSTFGPWQIGTAPNSYDALGYGNIRFESTDRMNRDAENNRIIDNGDNVPDPGETGRREWNVATEFYNHFGSHHGTCWNPETGLTSGALNPDYKCNDPDDPWTASNTGPGGDCEAYRKSADPGSTCYAGDADPRCDVDPNQSGNQNPAEGQMFRNATQYPGRLYVEIPDGRGVISLENQLWDCDHHVVHQLPPTAYSMTYAADYRRQKGGLMNTADVSIYNVPPGGVFGGTIGEMVIQYFTEPWQDPETGQERVRSIDVAFEVVQDFATTWYPPFTWHNHQLVWHAPFDMAIGLMTIHSHHRNVRGFIDILPVNPIRQGYTDEYCGGSKPDFNETPEQALLQADHVLENFDWEDARICEYWRHPDGPLVLRKGQAVKTTCYVNNGVTPEAIKHGLVSGAAVQGMRNAGIPIPPDPSTMPSTEWSPFLIDSLLSEEYLYGPRVKVPADTANYRVAYKCGSQPGVSSPTDPICKPDPEAIDADGDYIDGPWKPAPESGICPSNKPWCNPATIMFANVGEDEMCIPVFMFWPLDRLGGPGSENAQANLEEAVNAAAAGDGEGAQRKLNEVGLPGSIPKSPGDIGDCRDCSRVPTL